MAETETIARAQRGKLTLSDLGVAATVKIMSAEELAKNGGKYFMGYLFGKASGFVERKNLKDDTMMEGIAGSFIMQPFNGGEELESGVLFIPDAFHNLIATDLRKLHETDPHATLEFALEVFSIPAQNPAGYSWQMKSALPPTARHVLADTMNRVKEIAAQRQKQLSAPDKKK